MIRLVADQNIVGLERLSPEHFAITRVSGRAMGADVLQGQDALWVRSVTVVNADLLRGSTLRFVGTATAGVDHIDQPLLAALGIPFASAPGANANSVVEYVLAALARLVEPWELLDRGEPLAIVGYGHVGRLLARVAAALGWNARIYDPWLDPRTAEQAAVASAEVLSDADAPSRWVSFEEVLEARVISLHTSLHRRDPWPSHHLFDAQALARLSGEQWLINASRGAVIDNEALLARLESANPPQLVLDVWDPEPVFDPRLLDRPSLRLGTAHIAGYSWDAKWQATRMLLEATKAAGLLEGCEDALRLDAGDSEPRLRAIVGRGAALAGSLLEQRYRIDEDDTALRSLAQLGSDARGQGFDQLRRAYRVRRELRGSTIERVPQDDYGRRLISALGVRAPGPACDDR